MVIKNKALLIFDFVTPPLEKLYDRAARFAFRELSEGKVADPKAVRALFSYFPEIAAALGPKALDNPALSAALLAEPMASLRLLLTDYSGLAPKLESSAASSGEALYYLLKAAREQKLVLREPPDFYLARLLSDPFWALRTWGDTFDEKILAGCLQLAKTQKDKVAGAAYVHLYFTPDADASDFVELLSSAPMYAYLSSRHFYDRNIEFKYFNLRGLTPRWAYHFITDGFLDDEEGLIDTLLESPDWLVEYLVESERYKDLAYTKAIVDKALAKNPSHPMATYLKLWWERTQDYVKKLPPPKPIKIPGAAKPEEAKENK